MEPIRIWHNPRCSKSREAMELLRGRGVVAEVVDYLGQPPSPAAVAALLARLGGDPRQLVRFKEDEARALGLAADDHRTADEWAALLAAHPRLIERPVLEVGDRAVIGRPTERLLELLG
ncbi:arsenate reductase (glutaredoxin) [Arenimonas caeni]|jgi:arsenate reductase|uniref:Arsenate reductase n=1 Tax=Arenimonas caeni TaxID=2058085 RepID=A0A2P6M8H9_9GAMM|nr:arsenate reductase (glutaredoxin) [Arenimonas caeni]MDY0021844.1 arsenate reductase (glutaredoxin) [Arenimonas caeni]PRH82296.1 arsenate reductase (glutaredoxin) [Arenimonas caeni]